ncbi:MAG: NAD(P)/FAD-dependent oxidoreductase, partial [Mogibacterium sp.]|nr:NAD(P)/FAD-dependent oxidoreductase [Mogibacterium sp.]
PAANKEKKEETVSPRFVIESVYKDGKGEHRVITEADYVVLATGGKAGPTYGTTGDGYRLARELGHSIVTPVPVLTGIECREWEDGAVSLGGTRMQGVVSLYKKGADKTPIFQEAGEVQFTKYGLSGICVFNMTRCMRLDRDKGESLEDFIVRVNLFPEGNFSDYIYALRKGDFSEMPAGEILRTALKESLADYVAGRIDKDKPVSMLDEEEIQSICNMVHNMEFHPVRLRGWKDAQATSGGVSLDEIDEVTSESKIVPRLYITGELADKDFQCGGFNLSNAWLMGLAAADDISGKC